MKSLVHSIRWPSAATVLIAILLSFFAACEKPLERWQVDDKDVIVLTKDNFQSEVLNSQQPVLVDFWAMWCISCKQIAQTVADVSTELKGKAKVGKVDVDAQTELARKYDIEALPALLIFKDGKVVARLEGLPTKEQFKQALGKFVPDLDQKPPSATP